MKKIRVIYILGSGHCGSTLLDMVLGAHPEIFGAGELANISCSDNFLNSLCTCKKKVKDCEIWKKVYSEVDELRNGEVHKLELKRKKLDFITNKNRFFMVLDNKEEKEIDIKTYLSLNERIYEAISKYSGKKIIVDSSKNRNRAEVLSMSKKLELVLIHLVRNGAGVFYSYKRKYGGFYSPIYWWVASNIRIEILKRRNKNAKIFFMRYEDFVKNPERELKKILNPLNLEFKREMLNFRAKEQHQITGNRLRFGKESKLREDASWKTNLNNIEKIGFYVLAGWLNKYYGY